MNNPKEGFSRERIKVLQNWDRRNTLLQEIVSSTEDLNIPSLTPIKIRVLAAVKRNFPHKTKKSIRIIQEIINNIDGISQATPGAENRINMIKEALKEYIQDNGINEKVIETHEER